MAISIKRYVDIISGVGGAAAIVARLLIGRLFTTNVLAPTNTLIEFDSADEVGVYFGTTSEEYLRAVLYFGFISKSISSPRKLSFARWTNTTVAPLIFGASVSTTLAQFQAVTDGSFTLEMGAETNVISGLNFTTDISFANVATRIQTAIQTAGGIGLWTAATVAHNAPTTAFNLTGGASGDAAIAVTAGGVGTEISALLGWSTGAIFSDGDVAEEPVDAFNNSRQASNNFGAFLFEDALTIAQHNAVASANHALNVEFMYCVPVLEVNAQTWFDSLNGFSGTGLTVQNIVGNDEYQEMFPMIVLAATDYAKRNSVQNYMYQMIASLNATVTADANANTLDALRINYNGQTQQAGNLINFYQRGFLFGGNTNPLSMNVYANEMWLKDAMATEILNLLLVLSQVSANANGRNQITAITQNVIDAALFNGVISVGRELTTSQILFINQQTGDELAYLQVQNLGYWIEIEISEVPSSSPTEYQATYTLIYAKDESIRSVQGTHVLV